jgi:hypothetical protein
MPAQRYEIRDPAPLLGALKGGLDPRFHVWETRPHVILVLLGRIANTAPYPSLILYSVMQCEALYKGFPDTTELRFDAHPVG